MIKKYQLNFQKAKNYFEENLNEINELSDSVISFLKFELGDFFSLLIDESTIENINEFTIGGKTNCLINDACEFIFEFLSSNKGCYCFFDDFNSDLKNVKGDSLFESHGLCFDDEIYYVIDGNSKQDLIVKCLQRSNAIWHSMCVLSEVEFDKNKKTINRDEMRMICLNAKLILIGAYDAESYVVWEKRR